MNTGPSLALKQKGPCELRPIPFLELDYNLVILSLNKSVDWQSTPQPVEQQRICALLGSQSLNVLWHNLRAAFSEVWAH